MRYRLEGLRNYLLSPPDPSIRGARSMPPISGDEQRSMGGVPTFSNGTPSAGHNVVFFCVCVWGLDFRVWGVKSVGVGVVSAGFGTVCYFQNIVTTMSSLAITLIHMWVCVDCTIVV